jgi:hypothetical protein
VKKEKISKKRIQDGGRKSKSYILSPRATASSLNPAAELGSSCSMASISALADAGQENPEADPTLS